MIDAPIKCVAGWAGGKRTMAPRIVDLLGPHDAYFEPFVGGCSIVPAKPISKSEHVNDANPKVANTLVELRENGELIHRNLHNVGFNKSIFDQAVEALKRSGPTPTRETVENQLIVWWMGPGGIAGTTTKGWFAQRHSTSGGSPVKRWESFVASIPAIYARLQNVAVTCSDFRTFFADVADRKGVAIYADPPYFEKEFKYEHDFAGWDHEELADVLNEYQHARIVLSYRDVIESGLLYSGSRLDCLYPPSKWRRIEVEMSKNMASASGTVKRNVEVLLVNDAGGKV